MIELLMMMGSIRKRVQLTTFYIDRLYSKSHLNITAIIIDLIAECRTVKDMVA